MPAGAECGVDDRLPRLHVEQLSHLLGEILSTASRIVVMRDGRVIEDRPSRVRSFAKAGSKPNLRKASGSIAPTTVPQMQMAVTDCARDSVAAVWAKCIWPNTSY